MTLVSLRLRLGALAVTAVALLAVACGGGETESAPPDAATAVDTAPEAVERFTYQLAIALTGASPFSFDQRGAVVLPDREEAHQTYEVGALRQETDRLVVGERVWLRGDLPWVELGASPVEAIGTGASVITLEGRAGSPEQIDGLATTRYELTRDELVELIGGVADGYAASTVATIWVADRFDVPVQVTLSAEGDDGAELTLTLRITDLNSPSITVEAPADAQTTRPPAGVQR